MRLPILRLRVQFGLGNDMGGPTYNPVRILQINTTTGVVSTTVYDPIHGKTVNSTSNTIKIIK